jgi:CTP synthase
MLLRRKDSPATLPDVRPPCSVSVDKEGGRSDNAMTANQGENAHRGVPMKPKYIFVTGGVLSSLGKGLASASIGALMESRGLTVTIQKLDPYLNFDPGTMNPFQHGEVFVTDDGAETDLDLGHYERFTRARMGKNNNFTTGQVYYSVITKERKGDYLGGTVQIIPHITDEIKADIRKVADDVDLVIVEIGGTVGDIESLPFLEAIRQFQWDVGHENAISIHLTLVPHLAVAGALKTKPTQHSVKTLREIGIQPNILVCRTDRLLPQVLKEKIALFCNVTPDAVITAKDVENIYEVPLNLHEEGLDDKIAKLLNIWSKRPDLSAWQEIVRRVKNPKGEVTIALVGKYVDLKESYKSLSEAFAHGGIANEVDVNLCYVDAEELEKKGAAEYLEGADGLMVPGGFGVRGIEGKVAAIRYAREKGIPFFGICLGMQCAAIEFARNVLGLEKANSSEFDPDSPHPVIDLMEEQEEVDEKGGTMRLGAYPCTITPDSLAHSVYGETEIQERHRHRYEFNNSYRELFTKSGMLQTGVFPGRALVEIIELKDHPWFLACQFHPEFKSRPWDPHPLFRDFVKAAMEQKAKGSPRPVEHAAETEE